MVVDLISLAALLFAAYVVTLALWTTLRDRHHHHHAPLGCEECGNDDATVTITDGSRVCLDCAEELDP